MLKYLMIIFQFLWPLKELDINKDNFFNYKVKTNDRNYLYHCNIYSYIPNSFWIAIIEISLLFSYAVFKLIFFKRKNNKYYLNIEF